MTKVGKPVDTGTSLVLCTLGNGVALVTLNRPEARNALGSELTPALRRTIAKLDADPEAAVIVLTGAGGAFCAGGDVKAMASTPKEDRSFDDRVGDLVERQRTLTGALVATRKPTIAILSGAAAGAGLALALACDIRFAARSAFVSTGYARVGLTGDYGISWLLTRIVGTARARELMFTAERVTAERCEALGLVNRVFEDDVLQREAIAFASRIASGPRAALAAIKDNLDQALTTDFLTSLDAEAARLIQASQSGDHREAVRAFVEKRAPRFVRH